MRTRRCQDERNTATVLLLNLALLVFVLPAPTKGQTPPPAAAWVPQEAVLCLQVSRPQALLELFTGSQMTQAITATPFYRGLLAQPGFQEFLKGIKFLEISLETDWRTGLAKLVGGGITVAVCPQDTVVAILEAQDESLLQKLHEIAVNLARAEAEKQGRPERVASRQYQGITAWTFDGKEAHAIVGKRLLFSSRAEGLKAVLDLCSSSQDKGLAGSASFQAARKAASPQAAATVFVDLKPLRGIPQVARLFESQWSNPLGALTWAGVAESLRTSNWLSLELRAEGASPSQRGRDTRDTLSLRAVLDGKAGGPTSPAAFALPKTGDGAWPNLAVPRRLAAASLYRDLRGFYAAKDTLFPERTSGLIFFENMMGIFFTGRDLTTEVLAETQPEIRIVVAQQQYDPTVGTPQVKLPAFAAVLRLRHPEPFGKVVEEAWQKAVGLINFTRGQKAEPGLIIDRPVHKDVKYTVAYFSPADADDKANLDIRFNVRPALAMTGQYLILSSTEGLARDLIEALSREAGQAVTPAAQTHSMLELDGGQAVAALLANRETLVQGDMVKKGKTRPEAEAGIDMLIALVRLVDQARLSLGTEQGLTQAQLTLKLQY
ncbi:MAG: hypothetical protein FJ280_25095 [Planctomycetes bacterium]|nr:hypothetical protein [Planctomycetota bacterium]